MKKKIIFLIVFVPVYYLLVVILLQNYWFNYSASTAGLLAGLLHILAFVISLPFLTPFIVTDLGEYWPLPLQLLPFIFNALLWGIAILTVFGGIQRLRGKKQQMQAT